MNTNESPEFNIREYAIGSVNNRNHFESSDFSNTLIGQSESYQSYFLHSNKLTAHAAYQESQTGKQSVSGYKDAVRADYHITDIDVEGNLGLALETTRSIVLRLKNEYKVPKNAIRVRFSGNKGFHIMLHESLFGGFEASASLPTVHSTITREICKGFEGIADFSIYHTTALIRIENTQNAKSGLYCIPLMPDELFVLNIEDIKSLAANSRQIPVQTETYGAVESLVNIVRTMPMIDSDDPVVREFYFNAPDPQKIDTMFGHCNALSNIKAKSVKNEPIGHKERMALGTVLSSFGEEGHKRVHALLGSQKNYDKKQTAYYLEQMGQNSYKPELCLTICGKDNLCPAIQIIKRKSPIAFAYTYDKDIDDPIKSFVESYVVDKIVAHFVNYRYATNDQSFYHYKNGVYTQVSDGDMKSMLDDFLPYYIPKHLVTNTRLNALMERLKSSGKMRYDGKFNADMFRLNLKNGIYDLKSGTLSPHTPSFMSNIQLPFSYDPNAKCPVFDGFIRDIFNDNQDVIDYVMKTWCYLLLPTYAHQKVFVWFGSGRNGKGVLSRIITAMIGSANVSNEDIHELTSSRFSAINLKDKLVNFSTELKTNELDLAMLKRLSGGDPIAAEKKYKDKITFQNIARLVILANELPRFSELGNAVTQRFEFVEFTKQYNDGKADTKLDEKLYAELPGIFNRVVSMLPSILDKDGKIYFDTPQSMKDNMAIILSNLSNVAEFVKEKCVESKESSIIAKTLYDVYQSWCNNSGYKSIGKKNFNMVLRYTLHFKVEENTKDSNNVHVFGLELKKAVTTPPNS